MPSERCDRVDTVVLLEGRSDVAAVRAVATARGLAEGHGFSVCGADLRWSHSRSRHRSADYSSRSPRDR